MPIHEIPNFSKNQFDFILKVAKLNRVERHIALCLVGYYPPGCKLGVVEADLIKADPFVDVVKLP